VSATAARARPVPNLLGPAVAGTFVVALALPVFLLAGWPLSGWLLGALLYLAAQALGLALFRLPLGLGHLGASGIAGLGMMFRGIAVGVVVIAVAATDAAVGLAAGAVYGLAYTLELAVAVAAYLGGAA
jgi:hypothetical protein